MKRFLLILVALMFSIAIFTACGTEENDSLDFGSLFASDKESVASSDDESIASSEEENESFDSDSDSLDDSSEDEEIYYTVTFKQQGQADIVFAHIKENFKFTNIPTPMQKVGYTVVWDSAELAKLNVIAENVIVHAVETAKTYTIILSANGGTVSETKVTVVYGQAYELPYPKRSGHTFVSWKNGTQSFSRKGVWKYDISDTNFVAQWEVGVWTPNY